MAVSQLQPLSEVDWRAAKEIFEAWRLLKSNIQMECFHVPRSHNELADRLANMGRREGIDCIGYTYPLFKCNDKPCYEGRV